MYRSKGIIGQKQGAVHGSGRMACPDSDTAIADFLYQFTNSYRNTGHLFDSAAVIFTGRENITEDFFEHLLWQRLQAFTNLDAARLG